MKEVYKQINTNTTTSNKNNSYNNLTYNELYSSSKQYCSPQRYNLELKIGESQVSSSYTND